MYEPEELAGYRGALRGWTRRADDAEALGQLLALQAELDAMVTDAARRLHGEGYSWTELAAGATSYGPRPMTRQAARQRWAEPAPAADARAAGFHAAVDALVAGAAGVDLADVCAD